eukprot:TRINITY_DN13848_c0_g1_i1.p1 TRINITY_DN13848_c0_g1~~TRINITY_DN13848_c0_g1_i1.p1  ORF type:complete len:369 (-),score=38.62 TRINITY_DN13848_c0_g1_i1:93-1199(-)
MWSIDLLALANNTNSSTDDDLYGYIAVTGSILFFGSLGVPIKNEKVKEAKVDPMVFQLYYSFAIFVTGFLVWTYQPVYFTYYGIIGASLWVPCSVMSIFAIKYIGMSIAQGLWSGTTIIVSFMWGAIAFPSQNPVDNIYLSILGLAILSLGIGGLSVCTTDLIEKRVFIPGLTPFLKSLQKTDDPDLDLDLHLQNEDCLASAKIDLLINEKEPPPPEFSVKEKLFGVACALGLGILNGSLMVPLNYVPEDDKVSYVASFGIGVFAVTPCLAVIYFLIKREIPQFQVRAALIPGTITGILWSLGNFFSIYATKYLGLTIGYPLTQVALLVAGLWGVFYYREIKGAQTIGFFFISAAVLLGGAVLLSQFG